MASIHETAYPRLRSQITEQELTEIYTPTKSEIRFSTQHARQSDARVFLLVQLKLAQRLGYFMTLADAPNSIIEHIAKCIGYSRITRKALAEYDRSGARQRQIKLL